MAQLTESEKALLGVFPSDKFQEFETAIRNSNNNPDSEPFAILAKNDIYITAVVNGKDANGMGPLEIAASLGYANILLDLADKTYTNIRNIPASDAEAVAEIDVRKKAAVIEIDKAIQKFNTIPEDTIVDAAKDAGHPISQSAVSGYRSRTIRNLNDYKRRIEYITAGGKRRKTKTRKNNSKSKSKKRRTTKKTVRR